MKKLGISIFLAVLLVTSSVRPASALMIDASQIVQKIMDYLQKISETAEKISQQINQIKLMQTEGFNLDMIRWVNDDFKIPGTSIQSKIKEMIAATREKKEGVMRANQDLYKKGATTNFATKYDVSRQDTEYLIGQLEIAETNLNNIIPICNQKYLDYDMEEEVWERDRKWGVYVNCKTEQDLYATQVAELNAAVRYMANITADQKGKEIRAQNKDKNYRERDKHRETLLEAADKNETNQGKDGETAEFATDNAGGEWDEAGNAEAQQKDREYYHLFTRRYFYDPNDPRFQGDAWGKEKTVRFQSNLDRLNRERRYLYINSAVHLMQAASTARREIARRIKAGEHVPPAVAEAPSEYESLASYTATRIENIKTLLLYAQIQSVKLQYMAAKELLQAELRKDYVDKEDSIEFEKIDLNRYIQE